MILIFFHSHMQASIWNDRIGYKSIEEFFVVTGTLISAEDILSISFFTVSPLYPVYVKTSKSRKGTTIFNTLPDNVRLKNISDTWTSTRMTTLTPKCSSIGSYGSKLINILSDNFFSCPSENNSLNYKSITLTKHGYISSLDNYNKKALKKPT